MWNPEYQKALDFEVFVADGAEFYPITVDAYHLLLEHGMIPEGHPCELLGGQIIYKDRRDSDQVEPSGAHRRSLVLKRLIRLARELDRFDCHLQTHERIMLHRGFEPAPDATIVRGTEEDYRDRLPEPRDLSCIIRVCDRTLDHDRETRAEQYSDARIPCYVLFNLIDNAVEVYTEPSEAVVHSTYSKKVVLKLGDVLNLPTPGRHPLPVQVDRLLPTN